MIKLKNPWFMFGIIALSLGGAFLIATIIIFMLNNNQLSELKIALSINGLVWMGLGIIALLYYK